MVQYDEDEDEEIGCSTIGFVLVVGFIILRVLCWLGILHFGGK